MSHELRQPLTAIRYNAKAGGLLLEKQPPDLREVRAAFQEIVTEIARATELMEHVRMMLRHQEGVRSPVSINDICRNAIRLLQRDAQAKDVTVDVTLADGLPAVHGDAVQLQQVVLNLALNAIESAAMSERQGRVVLCTAVRTTGVELEVRDSGPGLPPQVQQHLFQSYFSTKRSGLGMGLVIVHQIVDAHNGQVRAENADGGGAIFRVTLPTEPSKSPPIAEHPADPRRYERPLGDTLAPAVPSRH
jgi:signal transduction histidine kinase